jgi:hypothetical protein
MTALDEALAACKSSRAKMPPHLAAWLVVRELERGPVDQAVVGQALFELLGGPGPPELSSIITRMVHPDTEQRFPRDGRELRQTLDAYVKGTHRPAGPEQVLEFLAKLGAPLEPRDAGGWLAQGPQLDASGRVSGRPRPAPSRESFEPHASNEPKLELAEPARRPQGEWLEPGPYRNEGPKKRKGSGLAVVGALVVLAAAAAVAFMLFPTLQRKLPVSLPMPQAASLMVTSTPDGASVLVEGQTVGTTPFATDNRWRGRAKLELRLDGYEPFKGSFEGGKRQTIGATLKKRK